MTSIEKSGFSRTTTLSRWERVFWAPNLSRQERLFWDSYKL